MRNWHTLSALVVVLAAALGASAIVFAHSSGAATHKSARVTLGQAAQPSHHFRCRVTAANQGQRWFSMRTTTHRDLRVYTDRGTRWGDCDWAEMHDGHYVDVHAYRAHGHWHATRMANWSHHGDSHDGRHHDDAMMP